MIRGGLSWRVISAVLILMFGAYRSVFAFFDKAVDHRSPIVAGGFRIGEPVSFERYWILPFYIDQKGLNSSIWVGSVKMKIVERKVFVTAVQTMPSKNPSHYGNHLDLGYLEDGQYQLIYLDPDGTEVPIKEIKIDNNWTEQEKELRKQNSELLKNRKK